MVGVFCTLPSPGLVEVAAKAGFDFAIIDMEHGGISYETAENMCRAADAGGITPIIRIQENGPKWILRALEIGALGLLVPWVNSREEAESAAAASRYCPDGERGWAPITRGMDYGLAGTEDPDFLQNANREIMVIVQIETKEAVANADEICSVPGVDLIFIGPGDLSQSLGLPGQFTHPTVEAAIERVIATAKRRGKPTGIFCGTDLDWARKWVDAGVQFLTPFVDSYKVFVDWRWEAKAFRFDAP